MVFENKRKPKTLHERWEQDCSKPMGGIGIVNRSDEEKEIHQKIKELTKAFKTSGKKENAKEGRWELYEAEKRKLEAELEAATKKRLENNKGVTEEADAEDD